MTAQTGARVAQKMKISGFSPVDRNLLSASSKDQSLTDTYKCRRAGPLQFVLGFEDQGARLRLSVVGPDDYRAEKTGAKTFSIEVADAAVGRWQYTITPSEVPYRNFPFTLTVGQKQDSR